MLTNGISAFLLFPTFKSSKPLTPTYCSRQATGKYAGIKGDMSSTMQEEARKGKSLIVNV